MKKNAAAALAVMSLITHGCSYSNKKYPDGAKPQSAAAVDSTRPTELSPLTRVTWEMLKTKIIEPRCMECHSLPKPEGGFDATSLAEVRARAVKVSDRTLIKQDMPINPYPPLSSEEKRLVADWIADGMQE
jgi:uncharacterized membrane protein